MEKNLEVKQNTALKATDIRAQVNLIHEVIDSVMKKDVHFGIIPGCKKPSLYKPGAEKILMTFRLVADNPMIEDLSTADSIRYRVTQRILNAAGGLVGAAAGECSSDEDKYKWRKPICDAEFDETPVDRRMEKWIKSMGAVSKIKRVRTNPADVGNTILKMAVKRALVAATLITTAASDVFDQDIEDLPPEIIDAEGEVTAEKPVIKQPEKKKETAAAPVTADKKAKNPISEAQSKRLYAIAVGNGFTGDDINAYLLENYGIDNSKSIEKEHYEGIVEHFQAKKDTNE